MNPFEPSKSKVYYWTAEEVNLWMHQLALTYNYYDLLIEDGIDGETLIDELKTEQVKEKKRKTKRKTEKTQGKTKKENETKIGTGKDENEK